MATEPTSGKVTAANPIDPTANVLALVAAEARRQDDLRDAERRLNEAQVRRADDLRAMTDRCNRECHAVQLKAHNDLATAEARRIDGRLETERIRIDALLTAAAQAVTLATTRAESTASALAERVDTSAKTLAQSVVASAEALRAQVTTTAETVATQINTKYDALEKRIAPLEQARYLTGGREEQRVESKQGTQWLIPVILTLVFGVFGVVGVLTALIVAFLPHLRP